MKPDRGAVKIYQLDLKLTENEMNQTKKKKIQRKHLRRVEFFWHQNKKGEESFKKKRSVSFIFVHSFSWNAYSVMY